MKQMSPKERFLRTVAGQPVDRIPIWPPIPWHPLQDPPPPGHWKADPNFQYLVSLVSQYCDPTVTIVIPEATAENVAEIKRSKASSAMYSGIFDRRFMLIPFDYVETRSELLPNGDRHLYHTVHTPKGDLTAHDVIESGLDTVWSLEPLVKDASDAESLLSVPHRFNPPDLAAYWAEVERLGDRGVPDVFITTPLVMVSHVIGRERSLEWTISEPVLLERMVETAYERIAERLQYLLNHGIGPIIRFGGMEQATPPMMSKRCFDRYILGYEKPLWEMVLKAGKTVWVHCHGRIRTILEDLAAGGVKITDPVEPPPQGDIEIGEAKRLVAPYGMTLIGGIQWSEFFMARLGDIPEMVRRVIEEGGKQHYVLGMTAGPDAFIDNELRDKIVCYLEAGLRYGTMN